MVDNKINGSDCGKCTHCLVCKYKNDFNDIRNAISEASVYKNSYDIVSEIAVNCKHYTSSLNTVTYRDSIGTITNPCDISTTYDISTTLI